MSNIIIDNDERLHNQEALLKKPKAISILAVEDDPMAMIFLDAHITGMGHHITKATNGKEAYDFLLQQADNIDVIIMDCEMPVMDGLTAVQKIKEHKSIRHIPIIMVTGSDTSEDMRAGLDAGVFYYVTKPVNEEILQSVLSAAIREAQQSKLLASELSKHKTSFQLVDSCRFSFKTLDEAEHLALFMANCFPDPEQQLFGIGALLVNAIEHGNLGIGYEKKSELLQHNIWRSEVNRLQRAQPYCERIATATFAKKENGYYLVVEDQGSGFDWQQYLQIDLARAGDNHGRGIAQSQASSFDNLVYNEAGNKAVAFVSNAPALVW